MQNTNSLPPNSHIETRAALAASRNGNAATLSHSVIVSSQSRRELSVLCGRIEIDNLADEFAHDINAYPTCKICASRDGRWRAGVRV